MALRRILTTLCDTLFRIHLKIICIISLIFSCRGIVDVRGDAHWPLIDSLQTCTGATHFPGNLG